MGLEQSCTPPAPLTADDEGLLEAELLQGLDLEALLKECIQFNKERVVTEMQILSDTAIFFVYLEEETKEYKWLTPDQVPPVSRKGSAGSDAVPLPHAGITLATSAGARRSPQIRRRQAHAHPVLPSPQVAVAGWRRCPLILPPPQPPPLTPTDPRTQQARATPSLYARSHASASSQTHDRGPNLGAAARCPPVARPPSACRERRGRDARGGYGARRWPAPAGR